MIEEIITIALKAAQAVLDAYQSGFQVYEKKDKSPVTSADLISHKIILEDINSKFPQIPVLSEESDAIPFEKRKDWKKFFLVDPLDGTKGFIQKTGEFTINIALIEKGIPTLGIMAIPTTDSIYFARSGQKAYKRLGTKDYLLPCFARKDNTLRIVKSKSRPNKQINNLINNLKLKYQKLQITQMGSSLKLCQIAEGRADIYPQYGPTHEWDTAAGHALLLATGGDIKKINSTDSLIYNKRCTLNSPFIAQGRRFNINRNPFPKLSI